MIERLLTIGELADRLGVTERHVRRMIQERRVPYHKVGRFVRFAIPEIDEWLAANSCPVRSRLNGASSAGHPRVSLSNRVRLSETPARMSRAR